MTKRDDIEADFSFNDQHQAPAPEPDAAQVAGEGTKRKANGAAITQQEDRVMVSTAAEKAKTTSRKPPAKPKPRSTDMYLKGMHPVPGLAYETLGIVVGAKKAILKNLSNTIAMLSNAKQFAGKIAYNELKQRIITTGITPMGEPGDVTDARIYRTTAWLQSCGMSSDVSDVKGALVEIGWRYAFHPVRDYLNGLPKWDGRRRLDNWLIIYCNAKDPEDYLRLVGPKWMIAAVARVYEPGCQMDTMLILEGDQNQGKSKTFRILGGEWFTDSLTEIRDKEAMAKVTQWWILEMGELHAMNRPETTAMKAFISRRDESFRPTWGHVEQTYPRTCVFAGTTNPNGGYLKDVTGGRRFWPVKTEGELNTKRLEKDRDQLWAEAKERYFDGEKWWLTQNEENQIAKPQQACRLADDVWTEDVLDYVAGKENASIEDILTKNLFVLKKDWTQAHRNRIGAILREIGFEHETRWDKELGKTIKSWVRKQPGK